MSKGAWEKRLQIEASRIMPAPRAIQGGRHAEERLFLLGGCRLPEFLHGLAEHVEAGANVR